MDFNGHDEENAILLIIGCGRSGTNLLSDALGQHPKYHNVSENRYVWNYRQNTLRHDVRFADEARSEVKRFIRTHFQDLRRYYGRVPIDKTPSNVFRVPFLSEIFPKAKIIHIIRDGRDNVASRLINWHGGRSVAQRRSRVGQDFEYDADRRALVRSTARHLRRMWEIGNIPPSRLPLFLCDNATSFLRQAITKQPTRWGERFPGMQDNLRTYGAVIACAMQWREGVMAALSDGRRLPSDRYIELKYEDLIRCPSAAWAGVSDFLALEFNGPVLDYLNDYVRPDNVGRWREALREEDLKAIERHIRPTMEFLGYPWTL